LGESPNERKYIVTIPGKGYKFVAEVKALQSVEEIVVLEQQAKAMITLREQDFEDSGPVEKSLSPENLSIPRQLLITRWLVLIGLLVAVSASLFSLLYRQPNGPSRTAIQSISGPPSDFRLRKLIPSRRLPP
jgi:hypothetical protein